MADLRSSVLEAARQRLGHGPCADPLVHDVLVSAHDLRVDEWWAGLAEALPDSDAVSMLGVPVRMSGTAVGSLNAQRTAAHAWGPSKVQAVQAFARVAGDLVGADLLSRGRNALATQLQEALRRRG